MRRVADADVSIVPLRAGIRESVPTKLYDSLAVGCPVVVAASGEAQREGSELGAFCTPPGDAAALAELLRKLARLDRSHLRQLGENGRRRVQERAGRTEIMAGVASRIGALA